MKTIALVEGWAGGPKLSQLFRRTLLQSGFKLVKNAEGADIVFAHSTGCYLLPQHNRSEFLILLDPPYWPGRSITGRWFDLMKTDLSLAKSNKGAGSFLSKKLWEFYYILTKPSFSWSVIHNQSDLSFLEKHSDKKIILVRNLYDQFCSSKIKDKLGVYRNVKYIEVSGDHEDYYTNPQPYIDLLLEELK